MKTFIPHRRRQGFTLIEVLVSLGVFLFVITVVIASIGTAGGSAANEARKTLAAGLLQDCLRDYGFVANTSATTTPALKLEPISWSGTPAGQTVWFDARGRRVKSADEAYFRCEIIPTRETAAPLGHLRGRMTWPAKRKEAAPDGEVELFTSLLLQ